MIQVLSGIAIGIGVIVAAETIIIAAVIARENECDHPESDGPDDEIIEEVNR